MISNKIPFLSLTARQHMYNPAYQCLFDYHANRCTYTTYNECYIVTTKDITNIKTITCLNHNVVLTYKMLDPILLENMATSNTEFGLTRRQTNLK